MSLAEVLGSALRRLLTYDLVGAFLTDPRGPARLRSYAEHCHDEGVAHCYRDAALILAGQR